MSIHSSVLFVEKEKNLNEDVFFKALHKTISWKKTVPEISIFVRIFIASLVHCLP